MEEDMILTAADERAGTAESRAKTKKRGLYAVLHGYGEDFSSSSRKVGPTIAPKCPPAMMTT